MPSQDRRDHQDLPLYVAYQPVVKITGGQAHVAAYECLLRVRENPYKANTLSVIRDAENDGSILSLDNRITRMACDDVRQHQDMTVWLNISQATLSSAQASTRIGEVITERGLANRVTIEITETANGNGKSMVENLALMRGMSLSVVIDDIDSGHSKRGLLGTDLIVGCKLSRNTTAELTQSGRKFAEVARLVDWCRRLGKTVVLEGVETEAELQVATELGVDFCQGFFFWPALEIGNLPHMGSPVSILGSQVK